MQITKEKLEIDEIASIMEYDNTVKKFFVRLLKPNYKMLMNY